MGSTDAKNNFLGLDVVRSHISLLLVSDISGIVMEYITELNGNYSKSVNLDIEIMFPRNTFLCPKVNVHRNGIIVIDNSNNVFLFDHLGGTSCYQPGHAVSTLGKFFWDPQLTVLMGYSFYHAKTIDYKHDDKPENKLLIVDRLDYNYQASVLSGSYIFIIKGKDLNIISIKDQSSIMINTNSVLDLIAADINEVFVLSQGNIITVYNSETLESVRFLNINKDYNWNNMYIVRSQIIVTTYNLMHIYDAFDGSFVMSKFFSGTIGTDNKSIYVYNRTGMDIYT